MANYLTVKAEAEARAAFDKSDDDLRQAMDAVEMAADVLEDRAGCYSNPVAAGALRRGVEALHAEAERIQARRDRNAADLGAMLQAARSDRTRLMRAMEALRKNGYVATLSEPRYSSTRTTSVEKAEEADAKRVWAYRNAVEDVFDSAGNFKRDGWVYETDEVWNEGAEEATVVARYDRETQPRAFVKGIYLHHGPDKASAAEAVKVLASYGLGVAWNESMGQTIWVSSPERAARKTLHEAALHAAEKASV